MTPAEQMALPWTIDVDRLRDDADEIEGRLLPLLRWGIENPQWLFETVQDDMSSYGRETSLTIERKDGETTQHVSIRMISHPDAVPLPADFPMRMPGVHGSNGGPDRAVPVAQLLHDTIVRLLAAPRVPRDEAMPDEQRLLLSGLRADQWARAKYGPAWTPSDAIDLHAANPLGMGGASLTGRVFAATDETDPLAAEVARMYDGAVDAHHVLDSAPDLCIVSPIDMKMIGIDSPSQRRRSMRLSIGSATGMIAIVPMDHLARLRLEERHPHDPSTMTMIRSVRQ